MNRFLFSVAGIIGIPLDSGKIADKHLNDAVGMFDKASNKLDRASEYYSQKNSEIQATKAALVKREKQVNRAHRKSVALAQRFRSFVEVENDDQNEGAD